MDRRDKNTDVACGPLINDVCRQMRALWFTFQREYWKWKVCRDGDDISEEEQRKREIYRENQKRYERKLVEHHTHSMFLSAISTLVEDAPQITLLLYIFVCCRERDILGES